MRREDFIKACRDGGAAMEAAMRALDKAWSSRLVRECQRLVRDLGTAEDIVQESFIKLWKNCTQFRGDSELLTWLTTILRRSIVDHLRRTHPEEPMDDAQGDTTLEVERKLAELSAVRRDSPEYVLRHKQLVDCLAREGKRFLREAPIHAAVMTWVATEGLSNEEVGRLLNRTPGATREFISQARKKARRIYAPCYELAFGGGPPQTTGPTS